VSVIETWVVRRRSLFGMNYGRPFTLAGLSRKLERSRIWGCVVAMIITGEPNEPSRAQPSKCLRRP